MCHEVSVSQPGENQEDSTSGLAGAAAGISDTAPNGSPPATNNDTTTTK